MSESGTAATSAMVIRNPPFPRVYPTQGRTPAYCCKPTIALRRRLTKFVQGRIGAEAFSPTGKFARAPTSCARWSNLGGFGSADPDELVDAAVLGQAGVDVALRV